MGLGHSPAGWVAHTVGRRFVIAHASTCAGIGGPFSPILALPSGVLAGRESP
jgi:hypothetical protein